jgi:hypothetical protein
MHVDERAVAIYLNSLKRALLMARMYLNGRVSSVQMAVLQTDATPPPTAMIALSVST